MPQSQIILLTQGHLGFGRLTAGALAQGGHTVYVGVNASKGLNRTQARWFRTYAREQGVDVRVLDMDLVSDVSVEEALVRVFSESGRIDTVVHNSLPALSGPAEAFLPSQLAQAHDRAIGGAQRVMRAAIPYMRSQQRGLVVWLSSSAAAGGTAPYLVFSCALAAGLDAMAAQYARELTGWGVETSIIQTGVMLEPLIAPREEVAPADQKLIAEYEAGPYEGMARKIEMATRAQIPRDIIPGAAAGAVAMVVDTPFGERPFRVHVDPARDGAEVVLSVLDRVREDMMRRLGFADLLQPQ